VRQFAVEQEVSEEDAPNKGMEAKAKESVEKGAKVCSKARVV